MKTIHLILLIIASISQMNAALLKHFVAINDLSGININSTDIDVRENIKRVVNTTDLPIDQELCARYLDFVDKSTSKENQKNAKKLSTLYEQCNSGYSELSFHMTENCVMNNGVGCFNSTMETKKLSIVRYHFSLYVLQDYLSQKDVRNCNSPEDVVEAGVEILKKYANDDAANAKDLKIEMDKFLMSISCQPLASPVTNVTSPDGDRQIQKRLVPLAVAIGVGITFVVVQLSLLGFLTWVATAAIIKRQFESLSDANVEQARNIVSLNGCTSKKYWGSCGVPGTSLSKECPDGGILVFSNSCDGITSNAPGSVMCGREGGIYGQSLPVVDSKQQQVGERWQRFKYQLLGFSKFKCRSLCIKFDNKKCEEEYKKQ